MTMEELMEEIERTGGKMKEPILFEFENHVDSKFIRRNSPSNVD